MKWFILGTLIAVLITPDESPSQLITGYGLKAAITSANQDFSYSIPFDITTKRRLGLMFGAYVEWLNFPSFSIVTQIEYAQRGMGQEFIVTDESGPEPKGIITLYSRLDYLSLPLLAKVKFPAEPVSPYLLAGPRIDYFLGGSSDRDLFTYDDFKKTTVGGSVGVGAATTTLLPVDALIEIRYNFDLTDSYSTQNLKIRNNAYDLWLGVGF